MCGAVRGAVRCAVQCVVRCVVQRDVRGAARGARCGAWSAPCREPCAWLPLTRPPPSPNSLGPAAAAPPSAGLKSSPIYLYNGVAMAVSFLILRIIGMGSLGAKLF